MIGLREKGGTGGTLASVAQHGKMGHGGKDRLRLESRKLVVGKNPRELGLRNARRNVEPRKAALTAKKRFAKFTPTKTKEGGEVTLA